MKLLEKLEVSKSLKDPRKHPSHVAAEKVEQMMPKPKTDTKPKPKAKGSGTKKKPNSAKKPNRPATKKPADTAQQDREKDSGHTFNFEGSSGNTIIIGSKRRAPEKPVKKRLREETTIDIKTLISTVQKMKRERAKGEDKIGERTAPVHRDDMHPDEIKANRKKQLIRNVIMPEGYSSLNATTSIGTKTITGKNGGIKSIRSREKHRGETGRARSTAEEYHRNDTPGKSKKTKKKDTDGVADNSNADNTPLATGGNNPKRKPNSLQNQFVPTANYISENSMKIIKALGKAQFLKNKTSNDNPKSKIPVRSANENKPGEKVKDVIKRLELATTIKKRKTNDNEEKGVVSEGRKPKPVDPNDLMSIIKAVRHEKPLPETAQKKLKADLGASIKVAKGAVRGKGRPKHEEPVKNGPPPLPVNKPSNGPPPLPVNKPSNGPPPLPKNGEYKPSGWNDKEVDEYDQYFRADDIKRKARGDRFNWVGQRNESFDFCKLFSKHK